MADESLISSSVSSVSVENKLLSVSSWKLFNQIFTFDIGAVRIGWFPLIDAVWLAVTCLPVIAQSAGADVLLLAAPALVDPLVVVHTFVQLEGRLPAEPLLTNVAFVRFLFRVNSQMYFEVVVMIETLQMPLEAGALRETL